MVRPGIEPYASSTEGRSQLIYGVCPCTANFAVIFHTASGGYFYRLSMRNPEYDAYFFHFDTHFWRKMDMAAPPVPVGLGFKIQLNS